MATRNSDINLIIRAKTEGERAVAGLSDAIEHLLSGAQEGSTDIAALGRTLAALDKAAATVGGSVDKASAALQRQRAELAENNAAYAAFLQQQAQARRVAGTLASQPQASKGFVGPQTKGFADQLTGAQAEVKRLDSEVAKLFNRIGAQSGQLNGAQSSLLKLSQVSESVRDAQATAEAQVELTTQAIREQEAAAGRLSDVQRRINDLTGVSRPDATGSAAAAANVLLQADNEFRLAEARAAGIQKLRDEEEAETALAAARERNSRFTQSQGVSADPRGAQAKQSAAVFLEAVTAEESMAAEARALLDALDPVAAIQIRLNAELARYAELAAAGKLKAEELAAAQQRAREIAERALAAGSGGSAKPGEQLGFRGLRPYELQNLGYQVNDVFTQLASGTGVLRTLGQQGGQIVQIFPALTSGIVKAFSNPYFLGAAAIVTTLGFALKKAADDAQRLRDITAGLTFRADGFDYDPKKLAGAAEALELIGAKAEDAKGAVLALVDQGLNPDLINQFARAAEQMSQRLGTALPDAAKQLAEAFTSGYDAVAQFDDKLNFLTASERIHIRTLFETGQAEAARTEASQAFFRQNEKAAAAQRGPWADATRGLTAIYKEFIATLADSLPVKLALASFSQIAAALKLVGHSAEDAIKKANGGGDAGKSARIAAVQDQIGELKKTIADYEAQIAKKPLIAGTLQRIVDVSKAQLAAAEKSLADLEKKAPDTRNNDPNSRAAKDRADELQRIGREDELQRLRDAGRERVLTAQEKSRREELAGLEAARGASDAVVAAAERRRAVAHETAAIEKESEERSKEARAEREREIKQFEGRVVGAEGGAGKNPGSTAAGFGQFTQGTCLSQFAKVFPALNSQLSEQQILALRQNEQVAKAIIDNYARENAKFLEGFGAKVTAGNLYLAHFLGPAGAKAVLTANGATPVDQIIRRLPNGAAALAGNRTYLRTDLGKGRYRTASELKTFIADRVSDKGVQQSEGQAALARLIEDAAIRQREFNLAVEHGNQDKQDAIRFQGEENRLFGTALIAAERRQAITNAERELRQKAEDANKNLKPGETPVAVMDDQVAKAKEYAATLFDVQHAKELLAAQLADAQRPVDELTEERDLLIQQRDLLLSMGTQIDGLRDKIGEAYDKLIAFYRALSPDQRIALGIVDEKQLDNLIEKLGQAKGAAKGLPDLLHGAVGGRTFLDAFSGSAATAFENFIKKVAAGKNVFKSFAEGVQEFVASFAQALAEAILKTVAFALALEVLSAITGIPIQALGGIAAAATAVHHTGGIVGQGTGVTRQVNPSIFAGAQRFHTGGIVGLAPDEQAIVAKKGEEVLTENDPRHRNNGGLSNGDAAQASPLTVINVADHDEAVQQALRRPAGEKVLFNFLRDNKGAVKAVLS